MKNKFIEEDEINDQCIININIRNYKYDLYLITNNKDEGNNKIITKDNYFIKDKDDILSKLLLNNIKSVIIYSLNFHGSYLEFNLISLIKNKKIKINNDDKEEEEEEEERKDEDKKLLNNERIVEIIHCYTPKKHRGKGIASLLAKEAYQFSIDHSLKVIPTCTYIKDTFLKLNSTYIKNTHL
jgi:predicted GNAT family acetyltransferase